MRRWLVIPAIACAALTVLGATLAPVHAAGERPAASITTELHPGWNMVGWLGPEAPVSELFEAVPALNRIYAWNSEAQRYQSAWSTSTPLNSLRQLSPGMGLWLFIDGEHPVVWTRPVAAEGLVLPLRSGWNLVAWSGDDAGSVGGTLTRLGDSLVTAFRWDAAAQQYDRHRPWVDAPHTLRGLNRGDALWLELTADGRWWVPGAARPAYEFGDHVSVDEREATRRLVEHARAVFAEYFGIHTADFTVSVSQELPVARGVRCFAGLRRITVPPSSLCTAHEYFHVLQFALADGVIRGPHGRAPNWLVEGPAEYAGWGALGATHNPGTRWSFSIAAEALGATINQGLASQRPVAVAAVANVLSLKNPQGVFRSTADYSLGFLATEWLVAYAGVEALVDYYRRLPASTGWERAFADAFGLSVEEFYPAFAAYRAVVAPPHPHVADAAVRPVVVFLGDVPMDVRTAVQAEMDRVETFLSERFGVDGVEYSVFLGADWDAMKETVHRLSPYDDYSSESFCAFWGASLIVSRLGCGAFPFVSPDAMIQASLGGLITENQPLLWFEWGLGHYVLTSYRVAQATTAPDAFRRYTQVLQGSALALHELETGEGWERVGWETRRAIETMAVAWLAQRVGEPGLLEYYRLLPRGRSGTRYYEPGAGSAAAAFAQAFGLSLEEFYAAFASYRASLTGP